MRTTTLDRLMGELPLPDLIEMDIEGAEYSALRGAEQLLRKSSPVIFLSTHGQEVHQACCQLLRNFGYGLHAIGSRSIDDTDELYCVKENIKDPMFLAVRARQVRRILASRKAGRWGNEGGFFSRKC